MNGQSLDTVSSVSRRIWSATRSRGIGAPTDAFCSAPCPRCVSAVSTTSVFSCTRSATCSPDHTCQSLPEPQELGGNSTGLADEARRRRRRTACRPACPASGSARSTRSSHTGPSYHQWPNSSVSNAATTCAGRPMRSDSATQPAADHVDEVGDVGVDRVLGALGIVGRLVVRGHVAAGDPGRLEAGDVVVGVEVAIGGVPGIAGLRRPHPVADLQVATERDDVGVADRPAQRGVAVQRRAVDHEMPDAGGGVVVFHAGRVRAFGRPDAGRACARSAAARRPDPRAARTRAAADSAAAGTDAPAVRRAARWCRRRSARAAAGCRRAATAW